MGIKEELKEFDYEKDYHDDVHNYLLHNQEYYNVRAKVAKEKYFESNDIPADANILEFGCGLGHNIALMKNAHGYDVSKFALAFCEEKGIKTYDSLNKIPNNSFDVVFVCHVLEHLEKPFEILNMLYTKLKPEGQIIIVLPCEHNNTASFGLDVHQHLFAWNFRSINNLLIKTKYKIIANNYTSGKGYMKLLPISRISLDFYNMLTKVVAFVFNSKELVVIAKK